jgi:hypothetical protein
MVSPSRTHCCSVALISQSLHRRIHSPAPISFLATGTGTTACAVAVCTCPDLSLMADASLARSLVYMVADLCAGNPDVERFLVDQVR